MSQHVIMLKYFNNCNTGQSWGEAAERKSGNLKKMAIWKKRRYEIDDPAIDIIY